MQTQDNLKELVKQKYSEIALQDKESNTAPAAVQDVAVQKYITL